MRSSKLLELIQVLDRKELERLNQFLQSPYFRKSKTPKEVMLLWQHLFAFSADWDSPELEKEQVYQVLYPEALFVPGKIDRVMSSLTLLIKDFISYEFSDLKKESTNQLLVLARFYRERKMEKPFRQTIKSLRKKQKERTRDQNYYLHQFLIDLEVSKFESFFNHRKGDYNVPATLKSLNIFYLVHRLEYTCWLFNQDQVIRDENQEFNITDLETYDRFIQNFQRELNFDEIPILKVYDRGIRLMQSEEEDAIFQELKIAIETYASEIPIERLKEMQGLCRNYCIIRCNKGEASFLEESFLLYKNHLEEGYLFYEGGLLPGTIRNIVWAGLRLKKYDWIYQFLKSYKDRIVGTAQPEEIYLFNLATYYFAIGEYDKALDCLVDRYEDIYYVLAAKRMELKIYYELKSEILESKIDAFKVYIYRLSQKILPEVPRDGNNNFVDILRQIRSSKTLNNPLRVKKITEKIETKRPLSEIRWLLEKAEEIL